MGTVNEVNEEVIKLWKEWEEKLDDINLLIPLIYNQMKTRGILFIGLNPSYNSKVYKRILKNTEYSSEKHEVLFSWKNPADLDIEKVLAIENIMIEKHNYFKRFKEIARCTTTPYEHIDLFFYRLTGQNNFEKKILQKEKLDVFVENQLKLSMKLIEYVSPKVIVVANARASKELKKNWKGNLSLEWNKTYGYHAIKLADKCVPVFFTSMLTGQRAMDNGSYKRLKWHISKALERTID